MWKWIVVGDQSYVQVDWVEAGDLERSGRFEEVPAWLVFADPLPPGTRLYREIEFRQPAFVGPGMSPKVEQAPIAEPTPEPEERAWIQIELLDTEGRGIAGEKCRIVLPNGKIVEQSTDRDGVVRIIGIPAGNCRVTFPNLDEDAWDAR